MYSLYFLILSIFKRKLKGFPIKFLLFPLLFLLCFIPLLIPEAKSAAATVTYDAGNNTILISNGITNCTHINATLGNPAVFGNESDKVFYSNAHINLTTTNAELHITDTDCTWLKLNKTHIAFGGILYVENSMISAYNVAEANESYILGNFDMVDSNTLNFTAINSVFHSMNGSNYGYLNGTASKVGINFYKVRFVQARHCNFTSLGEFVYNFPLNVWNNDVNQQLWYNNTFQGSQLRYRYTHGLNITENTISDLTGYGISILFGLYGNAYSNIINNNTIGGGGLSLYDSFNLSINYNTINPGGLIAYNISDSFISNNTVANLIVLGNYGAYNNTCQNVTFIENTARKISVGTVNNTICQNIYVLNNTITQTNKTSGEVAIETVGWGNYRNLQINFNNITEAQGYAGIATWGANNTWIEGNTVTTTDHGIRIIDGANITILANTIDNATTRYDWWLTGIGVYNSQDILIENNTLTNIAMWGINLGGSLDWEGYNLERWGCNNVTINNNTIHIAPFGYGNTPDSAFRIKAGINLNRHGESYSWWLNEHGPCTNVAITSNSYNISGDMRAYVWVDSNSTSNITISDIPATGYLFNYTDSYFDGAYAWMIPNRNASGGSGAYYRRAANYTNIWWMLLNGTHFAARTRETSDANVTWTFDFSGYPANLSYSVPNDNVTRFLHLYNISATERNPVNYTVVSNQPNIVFNSTVPSNYNTSVTILSNIFGEPAHVYINGVDDSTHWSFTAATNTTVINWNHSSQADFQVTFLALPNFAPVPDGISISNMEGCGNWLFAEERYYLFHAQVSDPNGYSDIDTIKMNFTDGVNVIVGVYDGSTWNLENINASTDYPPARIRDGSSMVIDSETINATFKIWLTQYILDVYNVSIYMWANDTQGAVSNWTIGAANYTNIYALGGLATYDVLGNASRIIGGDVFDLWAQGSNDTSSIIANLTFRNLQHIKLLPIFDFNTSINGGQVTYMMDYCINDVWIEGLEMEVRWSYIRIGGKIELELQIRWYRAGDLIKSDFIYMFHLKNETAARSQTRYWIDLWFNRVNASTTMGGRINAYEYSMTDSSHPWLRWLVGSNWGANYSAPKQSMCFTSILDPDGNVSSTKQIKLVRIRCKVAIAWIFGEGQPPVYIDQYVEHRDLDVFDLTFGTYPFTGVQTPVFDETRVPIMPQGGLLGAVVSALSYLGKLITDALGVGLLNSWNFLVSFLDTIAGALGAPGLFTFIFGLISQAWTWFVDSMAYLISLILIVFTVFTQTMGKFVNVLTMTVGQWLAMFQVFLGFLGGTYTAGINVWNDLSLWTWITLGAILYPLYLAEVWATRGMDAAISQVQFLLNVFSMILHFLFTVIQWAITLVTSIIESIPIAE